MGIPWRRKWQPTPVFLPGESHGQRSLAGYSPWHRKETDTTEQLTLLLSSSRGWDPRALSRVTALLARSCAGGSPVCPQGLPLSHSAPSPAPALLTSSGSGSAGASGGARWEVAQPLSSLLDLLFLAFLWVCRGGASSGREAHLWHKVGNERLADLKSLHSRWKNQGPERGSELSKVTQQSHSNVTIFHLIFHPGKFQDIHSNNYANISNITMRHLQCVVHRDRNIQ